MTPRYVYEELARRVIYDPDSGVIRWRYMENLSAQWNGRFAWKLAGNKDDRGYVRIAISIGKQFKIRAHQLAWFIYYGEIPAEIDHIDGIKTNNKIANLRHVTRAINNRNAAMKRNNTSGITGVSWREDRQRWRAIVVINGIRRYLGHFDNKEEAASVVRDFRLQNGFTGRHGEKS